MSEVKLPAGWVEIKCSEFCSGRNKTFNPSTARESSYVLYSVPSHATGQPEVVTPKEIGSSKQHVSAGDTLISKINPRLNRTWVVGEHPNQTVIASTEWIVFAASEAFIPAFLALFLQQARVRDFLSHNASGVGGSLTRIKPAIFDQVSLPLPPLAEQKRIVAKIEELFSELDAGEESLRRARRQLGVYRQSLLKQAFEGKLTAPWRAQHPDLLESPDQLLARIQAERQARYQQQLKEWEKAGGGGGKPKKPDAIKPFDPAELVGEPTLAPEWVVLIYGDLCSVVRNGISEKPSGTSGFKIARISAVRPMAFDMTDYRFIDCSDEMAAEYALNEGDLLFTRYNGARRFVGVCARFRGQDVRLYPDKLIRTCPDLPSLDTRFLEIALNSGLSRAWIETKIRTTAGQSGVSGGDVKAMPVPLCSLPEQQEIVCLLDAQFEVIEQNEREIDAALKRSEALRQSILKKAFTGQLVHQDPADEPASVLLERIQAEREIAVRASKQKTTRKRPARQKP